MCVVPSNPDKRNIKNTPTSRVAEIRSEQVSFLNEKTVIGRIICAQGPNRTPTVYAYSLLIYVWLIKLARYACRTPKAVASLSEQRVALFELWREKNSAIILYTLMNIKYVKS